MLPTLYPRKIAPAERAFFVDPAMFAADEARTRTYLLNHHQLRSPTTKRRLTAHQSTAGGSSQTGELLVEPTMLAR